MRVVSRLSTVSGSSSTGAPCARRRRARGRRAGCRPTRAASAATASVERASRAATASASASRVARRAAAARSACRGLAAGDDRLARPAASSRRRARAAAPAARTGGAAGTATRRRASARPRRRSASASSASARGTSRRSRAACRGCTRDRARPPPVSRHLGVEGDREQRQPRREVGHHRRSRTASCAPASSRERSGVMPASGRSEVAPDENGSVDGVLLGRRRQLLEAERERPQLVARAATCRCRARRRARRRCSCRMRAASIASRSTLELGVAADDRRQRRPGCFGPRPIDLADAVRHHGPLLALDEQRLVVRRIDASARGRGRRPSRGCRRASRAR